MLATGWTDRIFKSIVEGPARNSSVTIDQLTAREKECLRLLLTPMRAKGVARTTGLSVNTVNEHLKSARRKLGTSDSLTAARMLRELENPTNSSDTNKSGSSPETLSYQNGLTDPSASKPAMVRRSDFLPFAMEGRPWNDLSLGWRLAWPLLLLVAIATAAGAIMAIASELSQLTIALTR
jgi:DNA-binding CsgD family transcriptional regulator